MFLTGVVLCHDCGSARSYRPTHKRRMRLRGDSGGDLVSRYRNLSSSGHCAVWRRGGVYPACSLCVSLPVWSTLPSVDKIPVPYVQANSVSGASWYVRVDERKEPSGESTQENYWSTAIVQDGHPTRFRTHRRLELLHGPNVDDASPQAQTFVKPACASVDCLVMHHAFRGWQGAQAQAAPIPNLVYVWCNSPARSVWRWRCCHLHFLIRGRACRELRGAGGRAGAIATTA